MPDAIKPIASAPKATLFSAPAPRQPVSAAQTSPQAAQAIRPIPADPLDFSQKYNTPIPAAHQAAFDQWVNNRKASTGRNPLGDRYDYDVNGYFLSGAGTDSRGHGTDKFKKPNHPTFSDESQYHGLDGYVGGRWVTTPTGQFTYQPSQTNVDFHSVPGLQQYFQRVEPGVSLLPAQAPPVPTGTNGIYTLADLLGAIK
jgi:hypothetical protein